MTDHPHRLPTTIRPTRYDLDLRPDIAAATFSGTVTIDIDVTTATNTVTIHALDLEFTEVSLHIPGDSTQQVPTSVEFDHEFEWAVITFPTMIPVGPVELTVAFTGVLNDLLVGFYRSVMSQHGGSGNGGNNGGNSNNGAVGTDGDNADSDNADSDNADGDYVLQNTLAVTQFEATHARRAFPCFDEPEFKAVFSVSLVIPDGLLGVSNAAEIHRTALDDGWVQIDFADTIPMSTYLVAVVVGNLETTPTHMIQGRDAEIPLRVIYPPGNAHLCQFALEVADHTVRYFEDYYELPYPGDKIDLVAIPDFAFGAMENLGCITFREVLLLVDPDEATQPELQRVADVINHELAHMWFGDLVTMNWWNGIWLNEAFATFMEVNASESFRPEWDVWTTFGLSRSPAFETDSLQSTRPIEFPVITAADSEAMFDILTYEKGASVVRMLEQHLGESTFRHGIATYLARHAYGNTDTTDLWDAIEEVSGQPAREIMDSWIFQGGFPLIRVQESPESFTLTQERFLFIPEESSLDVDSLDANTRSWTIPMKLAQFGRDHDSMRSDADSALMSTGSTSIERTHELFQPNSNGTGFYRSLLSVEQAVELIAHPETSSIERFVMMDDIWATFLSGHRSIDDALVVLNATAQVIANASNEVPAGPAVVKRLAAILAEGARLSAGNEQVQEQFVTLAVLASESVSQQVTTATTSELPALLSTRSEQDLEVVAALYGLSGRLGNSASTMQHAAQLFTSDGLDALPAEFSTAVLSVVAFRANEEQYDAILQRSRAASTPQEQLRYLHALISTNNEALFRTSVDYALNEVRTQNAPYLLRAALEHRHFGTLCWQLLIEQWQLITEKFPSNSLPRMLDGIRSFTNEDVAAQVAEFLHDHPIPSGEQQIGQHIERMQVSVRAAQRITR